MLRAIVQTLKILTIAAAAILVVAGGVRVFAYAVDRSTAEDVGEPVTITIAKDETADQVADRLADAGLIRSKFLFTTQMRLSGGGLVAGEHRLRKGMTVEQIIDRITGAEVAAADEGDDGDEGEAAQFDITIPEGWRTEQIAEEAEKAGLEGGYDAFMAATQTVNLEGYEFLADRPEGASLEGYLFPDTYTFVSDNPEYNLQLMLKNFDSKFTPDMREQAAEMGLTIHQVLILASLVEKEAKIAEERPIIADIYIKRWLEAEDGWNLEADPTVQYVIGQRGNWWPSPLTDEQLHIDNPYNTYQNSGLPPGPICNPGVASIQAVLNRAETPYYFFFAPPDGDGKHLFAETKEAHDANVAPYVEDTDG